MLVLVLHLAGHGLFKIFLLVVLQSCALPRRPGIMFDDDFMVDGLKVAKAAEPNEPSAAASAAPKRGPKRKRSVGERGQHAQDVGACFAAGCDECKLVAKRWCAKHNRMYDNMWTQAKKKGETAALQQAVSTPEKAAKVLNDFEENNPSHSKYARKNLIQWSSFKREHTVSRVFRSRAGCKPFELKQWLRHGEFMMGWSPADTKAEWSRWMSSDVDRDHLGLNGAERLWIPVIEERHTDDLRSRSNTLVDGGAQEKDMDASQRQALLDHLHVEPAESTKAFLNERAALEDDDDGLQPLSTPKKKAPTESQTDSSPPPEQTPEDCRLACA